MPLRIRVTGRSHANDLFRFLREIGADARKRGDMIYVQRAHPVVDGEPEEQDRMELEFVVRAWSVGRDREVEFEIEEPASASQFR